MTCKVVDCKVKSCFRPLGNVEQIIERAELTEVCDPHEVSVMGRELLDARKEIARLRFVISSTGDLLKKQVEERKVQPPRKRR